MRAMRGLSELHRASGTLSGSLSPEELVNQALERAEQHYVPLDPGDREKERVAIRALLRACFGLGKE